MNRCDPDCVEIIAGSIRAQARKHEYKKLTRSHAWDIAEWIGKYREGKASQACIQGCSEKVIRKGVNKAVRGFYP